jgi:hypothetical protein
MTKRLTILAAACLPLAIPFLASAHGGIESGTTELVVGWAVEPAYAGFPNAVEVIAEHDGVLRNDAKLTVQVIFGEEGGPEVTDRLRLEKAFGQQGSYHAPIIPTEPGTYTFRITGRVGEDQIDEHITSGPATFDSVDAGSDVQFPTKVPPGTELAAASRQQLEDLADARAEITTLTATVADAESAASTARLIALIALAVGALSALFGFAALRRSST